MRRLAHVLIVLAIVAGVRACGSDEVETRLASGTRWMAHEMGLTYAAAVWNERVRPAIVNVTTRTTRQGLAAVSRGLERAGAGVAAVPRWIWSRMVGTAEAVVNAVRALFLSGPSSAPGPDDAPADAAAT